jgi:putative ABC transport system permease protein
MAFRDAAIDPYGAGGEVRNAWLLVAVALVVLLIACANAAGLLLVRGQERLRELALRASLGASVGRLRRQLLAEALLLALAGIVLGVLLAGLLVDLGRALAPSALLQPSDAGAAALNPLALAAACASALAGLLLAALLPSLRLARVDACAVLRAGEQHSTGGPRTTRWRTALVTVQLALTLVLLIAAGLLLRTLASDARIDPGFVVGDALVASIDPGPQLQAPGAWPRRLDQIGASLAAQPGVESVAWMNAVPVLNNGMRSTAQSDHPDSPVDGDAQVYFNVVSPEAFSTLGVPLLRGRAFGAGDDGRAPVAIVNAAYAERFFPGVDPVGRRIVSVAREQGGAVVVGVVADHRQRSLREDPQPQVYVPVAQFPPTRMSLVLRTRGDIDALALALPQLVAAIDRDQPVHGVRTLAQQLGLGQAEQRTFAWLFGGFGALACLLAAAGLYGLLAGWLRSRVREIGIRLAVGASRGRIAALLLGQALRLWLAGALAGLALALLAGRGLGSLRHGVSAVDPLATGAALLVLALVVALATWLPLRRALRVDPIIALRHD